MSPGSQRRRGRGIALTALAVVALAVFGAVLDARRPAPAPTPTTTAAEHTAPARPPATAQRSPPRYPRVVYRDSRALGLPHAGTLVRSTHLPARGADFATWDPVLRRAPNRRWRRHGTDELVRTLLTVARRYSARRPGERPMLIGDLSRPRGGDFGIRYGIVGHSTHQNGLDADVYYPRVDRRLGAPTTVAQVDRRLSQHLVDLFVAAGAETVLVGPNVALSGPPGVVIPYPNHDNHLHVRIGNPGA